MRILRTTLISLSILLMLGFKSATNEVELSCVKNLKSTNTCHFNFKVDGQKFRFIDNGCRYMKDKESIIKKAKEGELALAKDWKIDCPESKEKKDAGF